MTDTKVQSNDNVTVWWVPEGGLANYEAPTPAEINAGQNLTCAIAWDSFSLGASASDDQADRGLCDAGNATTRGNQQFAAALRFFREKNLTDQTSIYNQAFETFRELHVTGYLVMRVLQAKPEDPAAAGQFVSVYHFMSDALTDTTEGDTSYKFGVDFLPQGDVKTYAIVATSEALKVPATLSATVGEAALLTAKLGDTSVTQGTQWTSSDYSIANVTPNGVVVPLSAGTATITATHPSASAPVTCAVTVA